MKDSQAYFLILEAPLLPDRAENNRRSARELGFLDATPITQTFTDAVSAADTKDFYRFELLSESNFRLDLDGLSANANVFLQNASGSIIASSLNRGSASESISTTLDSGTYYILVRSADNLDTNYELTLSAQFVVREKVVSDPGTSFPDPEYDQVGFRVTWRDLSNNLWVAPVDSLTGDLILEQKVLLDTGLVDRSIVNQGPEWVYTQDGSQILYTKLIDGSFFLGRARLTGSSWQTEILPESQGGHSPVGSLNPGDRDPLIRYTLGTPTNLRQGVAWRELDDPSVGGLVPETADGKSLSGRWVSGRRSLIYAFAVDNVRQVFKYDVDTDLLTQLTFDSSQKSSTFMWQAPELNNKLVFFALENNGSGFNQIGVYRKIDGSWTKFKTVDPPSQLPEIYSPEPFVYNGKSYISFATIDANKRPLEVWIAGIDPNFEFYRQITDPNLDTVRSDPESFITQTGAFVYYSAAVDSNRGIYLADTGLGAPAFSGSTLDASSHLSLFDLTSSIDDLS
jgi:hypothetical protein